jgi:hypothetical protein
MNLTLGFIAFFISIVIPGILFRRFFFYGEFSKQFNTKDPVLHSIFFSIIPGIVMQLICITFYKFSFGFESSYLDVFTIFRDITSDGTSGTQDSTKNFINNDILTFFFYSLCVFSFSAFSGWASSRFIRARKWDKKFKLFRFKNQWYYIFSGEVLNMKKFEDAHKDAFKRNKGKDQDTLMTYADILVSVSDQNDRKELYTGYVVDYDLKSDDISKLDKVYLIDTHRYKKIEQVDGDKVNEQKDRKKDFEKKPTHSRNRVKVPGDVFVLNADNIVNLNLTYVPSVKKKIEKKRKEEKRQRTYRYIQNTYLVVIFVIVLLHFFYKALGLDDTFLGDYLINTGFFGKLLVILFINQVLSFTVPALNKKNKLVYDFKTGIGWRILTLALLGSLSYWFVIQPLM